VLTGLDLALRRDVPFLGLALGLEGPTALFPILIEK
jgi:hypothetical protein